jgi:flagellar biosynthesis protein FlhB
LTVPQSTEFSLVQKALLIMFFGLFFYVWGAANLEGLLNYPFWRDMGPMMTNEDFIKLRSDHLWKIAPLLVLPVAVLAIVTLSLVFLGPPSIPAGR